MGLHIVKDSYLNPQDPRNSGFFRWIFQEATEMGRIGRLKKLGRFLPTFQFCFLEKDFFQSARTAESNWLV